MKKVNVVLFWFMYDWRKYGRTYEKVAEGLSKKQQINRVYCFLPPQKVPETSYAWPLKFVEKSEKLVVLHQNNAVFPVTSAPYAIKKWINNNIPRLWCLYYLKFMGLNKKNTILWVFPPHESICPFIDTIPHYKLVVQIVDNNSFLQAETDKYRLATKEQYEGLASSADKVIVSSEFNFKIFSKLNTNCHVFENAVDEIFIKKATALPCKKTNSRPRIGYVGWLTRRTDLSLLQKLATNRPGYDIVLAGPIGSVDVSDLIKLENVTWVGRVPYSEVPQVIGTFDVCLIPHVVNSYTQSMSPLKMYQYLGSGRPIVSTKVAGVECWGEHVYISDTESFVDTVDIALSSENIAKAESRIAAVSKHTWKQRINSMLEWVLH